MIDWLTLRAPIGPALGAALQGRLEAALNTLTCCSPDGEVLWAKRALDVERLRSDSVGLFWQVQSDGQREYLVVGGSPASLEHGCNVFGSGDVAYCAAVLVGAACRALGSVLPAWRDWECRRVDVTRNFLLPGLAEVGLALRQLVQADAGRRKASHGKGGDTVYWNPASDLIRGKAYAKGPHVRQMVRRGRVDLAEADLGLVDRLLRLELTLGARWFRRLADAGGSWCDVGERLAGEFERFFGPLVGGVEVSGMSRDEIVGRIVAANGIGEGRALSAYHCLLTIRAHGWESARASCSRASWFRWVGYLRRAGITEVELRTAQVIELRRVRVVLGEPVGSWQELRRAA